MNLVVLADNNTFIDRYYLGEPGFCVYIEDENKKILLDLGYSDVFIKNAVRLHIDLANLDYIALSHGHSDHTWGLASLIRYYVELEFEHETHTRPLLIGHPETLRGISEEGYTELGSIISEKTLKKFFNSSLMREPQHITKRLIYLGEIPRRTSFEGRLSFGKKDGTDTKDFVPDDSALVYKAENGIVIITGCSHSGICNIVEYAKELTKEHRILDIIGGFHLLNPSPEQLDGTVEYFKNQTIERMHPCHCTDLKSIISLSSVVAIEEAGVSLQLVYS